MAGSNFGKNFRVTTWGESHGKGIGVVVDGCPSNLPLSEKDIQEYLDRRKPGQSQYTTKRNEDDQVEILSGVFEGKTTGTPISLLIRNKDQHSRDYGNIKDAFRPGHADYTFDSKYGIRDYRGGGRSSGRETIGRVAAGAIASKILKGLGITLITYTKAIGPHVIDDKDYNLNEIFCNPLYMPSQNIAAKAGLYLENSIKEKDSVGGIIEGQVLGLPPGIGEPVFDKLDACLSKALMSIGGVKGIEIGSGFEAAKMPGSLHNDSFQIKDNKVDKATNHAGGILGGISDGSPLTYRLAVKPTPSIAQMQRTINQDHTEINLEITGRHDPIIVPRAVVVAEAMTAITVLDLLMENTHAKMEYLEIIYKQTFV